MRLKKHKAPKDALRGALFAEAEKLKISEDELRNVIAPSVIKKRISQASAKELGRLIEHVTGKTNPPRPSFVKGGMSKAPPLEKGDGGGFRYESSKSGLLQELEDVARARWGEDFPSSLNKFANKFINRKSGVLTPYRMMRVGTLVAVKNKIRELNREDARA